MLKIIPIIPFTELFAKALSFLIIILLTRMLPISEYGIFNYVVSLVLLVSVLMDGGINNYIFNKSLKNEIENINDYFNSRIFLSLMIIGILLLWSFVYDKQYFEYIALYAVFVFLNSSLSFFKMLARGQNNKKLDIETIILDPLFRLLVISILYFFNIIKIDLLAILKIFVSIEIIVFLWVFLTAKKIFILSISIKNILIKLKFILNDSKYFLIYYLFFVGLQRIDILFINHTLSSKQVALFSSSYNLYMVILLFFSSYLTSGFRKIIHDKSDFLKYIRNLFLFYVIISTLIIIFSKVIYKILYPVEYFSANIYLIFFMISLPFTIISYFTMYFINFIGKTYLNSIILLLFFFIKFIFLYFLNLNSILSYVYFSILIEILLGITYLYLLFKHKEKLI